MATTKLARVAALFAAVALFAGTAEAQQVRTIRPGMTTAEVITALGAPAVTSARGNFTYYFYDNGCEQRCGFLDLVIFDNGRVVDAVLRAPWHAYEGESSSPKGTVPRPTPAGMRLDLPAAVEGVEVRQAPQVPLPVPADTTRADTTRTGG
ncbi:MAG: hypothetical protein JSU87_00475 [Gemmatimonadota bacterium]|nr:MAG: hypothetical protein JSU87_00475 [Gemmatimonadota bacterium]